MGRFEAEAWVLVTLVSSSAAAENVSLGKIKNLGDSPVQLMRTDPGLYQPSEPPKALGTAGGVTCWRARCTQHEDATEYLWLAHDWDSSWVPPAEWPASAAWSPTDEPSLDIVPLPTSAGLVLAGLVVSCSRRQRSNRQFDRSLCRAPDRVKIL